MSIAIYRRYRPQTFQEVIGQDHVVSPLQSALAAGRTTHAYLFSGPRGCGKTTSARILARSLNCAQYPTDTPCGECESCIELARDGSGSLDVVEMDAASHGGVDDARELREQAGFAPVRDRFKIFIIDEAHMVSNQGFNALLKLVEEPPEHVKFIFATTEPEKVIGTIRSRTHHYPFRLVPPQALEDYLAQLCDAEGVQAGKDVLSLVVRAGTGSVRDTLSVLDQIIGGSDGKTLDYDRAVALLGYTSAQLLDDAVTAVAQRDGAALFSVVDSVVKSGHDPRRFVEDLLQRLRDIVIISLAGEDARDVFVSVPQDQYERMFAQAGELGAARASRCADLTNEALSAMVGATAPRLQLELLCARLIVAQAPGAVAQGGQASDAGAHASSHGAPVSSQPAVGEGAQVPAPTSTLSKWKKPTAQEAAAAKAEPAKVEPAPAKSEPSKPELAPAQATKPGTVKSEPSAPSMPSVQSPEVDQDDIVAAPPKMADEMPASARAQVRSSSAGPADAELGKINGAWSQILEHGALGRVIKTQLGMGATPVAVEGGKLSIGFENPGLVGAFNGRGGGQQVAAAIKDVLGLDLEVEATAGRGDSPKADAAQGAADQPRQPITQPQQDNPPLPQEPNDGLEEPEEPELDPVYDYAEPTDQGDPAGVLGPLLDGTAKIIGEDNTSAHLDNEPANGEGDAESRVDTPSEPENASEDTPFYEQDMPAMPPSDLPNRSSSGAESAPPVEPTAGTGTTNESVASAFGSGDFEFPSPPPVNADGTNPEPATDFPAPPPARQQAQPRKNKPVWEVHPPVKEEAPEPEVNEWDEVSADDPDISESNLVGIKVLIDRFDGKVIEEIPDAKEVQ